MLFLKKRKKIVGFSLENEEAQKALRRTCPIAQTFDESVEAINQPHLKPWASKLEMPGAWQPLDSL